MRNLILLITLIFVSNLAIGQNSKALIEKAENEADSGNFPSAINILNTVIESDQKNEEAFGLRGNIFFALGMVREAISDYSEAIKIRPENFFNYYGRGQAKAKFEDHRGAIMDYNKSIELQPDQDYAYFERAKSKVKLRNEDSINDVNKAIELNPDNPEYYYFRGLLRIVIFSNINEGANDLNEGCIDLSIAGELGHKDAYAKIKEYCN